MFKKSVLFLLVIVMVFSLVACKQDAPVEKGEENIEAKVESKDEIKIGLYGTITGSNALAGEMLEKGGQLAVKEINAAGGINGRPLKLIVYDDKSSPEGAVKAVTRLVDVDKVVAMVGSNSSPNILATTQITEESKTIQVGSGTSPAYTNAGFKYLFRGVANGNLPNAAAVDAMKEMGVKTIGILSVASEYGKSGIESFKEHMEPDIEVVAEEIYQSTDTDYTGQIAKILNAKPDGILIYGMTNESALAIKQFRRNGYKGYIYGPEGLGVPDLLQVAGEDANDTIFGTGAIIPASVEDASSTVEKTMLEAFVEEYGGLPVSDVVYRGYDGVKLIAEALKNAKDIEDPESIREAFINIKGFEGVAGSYDFSDESGDGLKSARSYIIQDGKHVLFSEWRANNKDK
ncbi:ABC transporter substrate-binding protein [Schnuerera ultunensis]|uniref:Ligand-binding protein, receptor family n=1 Tax=[Clostridium] ultunense Esp TaxID=1288971 RepID=A0A1M4PL67_9FIRM|nr:ABC transporter substrate-binding protein [Schnuerera ultunensis]SHD76195.1 Ligand-binding protein, receptor family [[Clostridium] ultunense Esp]